MSFLGILGGAMQGGGEAGEKGLQQEQKYEDQSDLQSQYVQAMQMKDMALAQQTQEYAQQNNATNFNYQTQLHTQDNASAEKRTQMQEDGSNTRNSDTNASAERRTGMETSSAERRTAAEIGSRQVTDIIQATKYLPNGDGTTTVSRPDGKGGYVNSTLTDLSGKPVMGIKNVPESVLKEADLRKTMLTARINANGGQMTDEMKAEGDDIVNLLHAYGGTGGGGAGGSSAPAIDTSKFDTSDVTKLLQSDKSPEMLKAFDNHYGKGAAKAVIQAQSQQQAAAPAAPAVGDAYGAANAAQPVVAPNPAKPALIKSAIVNPGGAYSTSSPPQEVPSKFANRQATGAHASN